MSNGSTQKYNYQMENDMVTAVRLQPETRNATVGTDANDPVTGTRTLGIPTAKVSLTDGEIGIRPRAAICSWTTVAANSGYTVGTPVKITLLAKASVAIFAPGAVADYLGGTITVDRIQPEQVV